MDEVINNVLPFDDVAPDEIKNALAIDRLIQMFLSYVEEYADIEVVNNFMSKSSDFFIVHGDTFEEVIARGRDGVFVYAVPVQNEIPGQPREP